MLKNLSHESKASQLNKIRQNRRVEKDIERASNQTPTNLAKPSFKIITNDTADLSDEEISLNNPTYSHLLFEDD